MTDLEPIFIDYIYHTKEYGKKILEAPFVSWNKEKNVFTSQYRSTLSVFFLKWGETISYPSWKFMGKNKVLEFLEKSKINRNIEINNKIIRNIDDILDLTMEIEKLDLHQMPKWMNNKIKSFCKVNNDLLTPFRSIESTHNQDNLLNNYYLFDRWYTNYLVNVKATFEYGTLDESTRRDLNKTDEFLNKELGHIQILQERCKREFQNLLLIENRGSQKLIKNGHFFLDELDEKFKQLDEDHKLNHGDKFLYAEPFFLIYDDLLKFKRWFNLNISPEQLLSDSDEASGVIEVSTYQEPNIGNINHPNIFPTSEDERFFFYLSDEYMNKSEKAKYSWIYHYMNRGTGRGKKRIFENKSAYCRFIESSLEISMSKVQPQTETYKTNEKHKLNNFEEAFNQRQA